MEGLNYWIPLIIGIMFIVILYLSSWVSELKESLKHEKKERQYYRKEYYEEIENVKILKKLIESKGYVVDEVKQPKFKLVKIVKKKTKKK